jgi:hypothetical protein
MNSPQRKSVKTVGLDLQNPCFAHGLLQAGCSTVEDKNKLSILSRNGKKKQCYTPEIRTSRTSHFDILIIKNTSKIY